MTGFIAWVSLFPNRVSVRRRFEGLEPDDRKLSRPVLRGPGPRNGVRLLGLSPSRCQRKTRGRADRYSFPVRLFHSLLHAGLSRRTDMAIFHQRSG